MAESSSHSFKELIKRNFINPQMLALIVILAFLAIIIYFFGRILAPVFFAIGLSYLLNFPLSYLMRKGVHRYLALFIVFACLAGFLFFFLFYLAPLLIKQIHNLVNEAPNIVNYLKQKLSVIQQYLAPYISQVIIYQVFENIHQYILQNLDVRIDNILAVFQNALNIIVNLVLVPVLSFLLLLDYIPLKRQVLKYLPEQRQLATGVFAEFLGQLNNYVKGKMIELTIMFVVSFITFSFFGLKYNLILSLLIGISVIVPILGIVIASVPLVLVAFFQYDLSRDFFFVMLAHLILQTLNVNVLIPWLYSKSNNLRPFSIVVAVLVFGKIWGVVGIFLAIPLATLIKALGNAWLINTEIYKEAHEHDKDNQNNTPKDITSESIIDKLVTMRTDHEPVPETPLTETATDVESTADKESTVTVDEESTTSKKSTTSKESVIADESLKDEESVRAEELVKTEKTNTNKGSTSAESTNTEYNSSSNNESNSSSTNNITDDVTNDAIDKVTNKAKTDITGIK